eukprot:1139833-Pelagomonas_calceolata.AAC.2
MQWRCRATFCYSIVPVQHQKIVFCQTLQTPSLHNNGAVLVPGFPGIVLVPRISPRLLPSSIILFDRLLLLGHVFQATLAESVPIITSHDLAPCTAPNAEMHTLGMGGPSGDSLSRRARCAKMKPCLRRCTSIMQEQVCVCQFEIIFCQNVGHGCCPFSAAQPVYGRRRGAWFLWTWLTS